MEGAEGHIPNKNKREGEKRSGSRFIKWRFSAVLSFLDPLTTPRETSGNMGQGVEEALTTETSYEEGRQNCGQEKQGHHQDH